jgi:hypothetical protein
MKNAILIIGGIILWAGITYGLYWVVKTVSYELFYADMVEETVREMVAPEFLIIKSK